MEKLIKLLTSVRVAVVLILFIVATSGISTFIPQAREAAYYVRNYPAALAKLIDATAFNYYFQSLWFIVPLVLFFINLAACSVHRLVTRLSRKSKKRFGPDLIHFGVLLLIVAGVITAVGREEAFTFLKDGDRWNLPDGYVLELDKFEYTTYPDGRPRDWISHVRVTRNGRTEIENFAIEVNRPLAVAGLSLYQASFEQGMKVGLEDEAGRRITVSPWETVRTENGSFILKGTTRNDASSQGALLAVFEIVDSGKREIRVAGPGETVGPYRITALEEFWYSGLQAVRDPGTWLILVAFLVTGAGLTLTTIQKLGEKQ